MHWPYICLCNSKWWWSFVMWGIGVTVNNTQLLYVVTHVWEVMIQKEHCKNKRDVSKFPNHEELITHIDIIWPKDWGGKKFSSKDLLIDFYNSTISVHGNNQRDESISHVYTEAYLSRRDITTLKTTGLVELFISFLDGNYYPLSAFLLWRYEGHWKGVRLG